jgi:hypothetical protein
MPDEERPIRRTELIVPPNPWAIDARLTLESASIDDIELQDSVEPAFALDDKVWSGEAGIRTLGTLAGTPVFKTGAIGRSATSPDGHTSCIWDAGRLFVVWDRTT